MLRNPKFNVISCMFGNNMRLLNQYYDIAINKEKINIIIDNNDSSNAGCFGVVQKSFVKFLSSKRIHPDTKIVNKEQQKYKEGLLKALMPYREFGSCEDLKIRKYLFNVFGANLIANSSWTQPGSRNNIGNTNTVNPIDIGDIEKTQNR